MAKFLRLIGGIPRMVDAAAASTYDQVFTAGTNINAGTNITLPSSETYDSSELEVYFDGQFLEPVVDYNYVGSPPRTQIQLTFDIFAGEKIRFRKLT